MSALSHLIVIVVINIFFFCLFFFAFAFARNLLNDVTLFFLLSGNRLTPLPSSKVWLLSNQAAWGFLATGEATVLAGGLWTSFKHLASKTFGIGVSLSMGSKWVAQLVGPRRAEPRSCAMSNEASGLLYALCALYVIPGEQLRAARDMGCVVQGHQGRSPCTQFTVRAEKSKPPVIHPHCAPE